MLVRGVWWLPGRGGDEVLARVREAAVIGKNEEVLKFIVAREDQKARSFAARIDLIKKRQIPELEKLGAHKVLAREWFSLGYCYFRVGKPDEGRAAYDRVREIAAPSELCCSMVPGAIWMEERLGGELKDKKEIKYRIGSCAHALKRIGTELTNVRSDGHNIGWLASVDTYIDDMIESASCCDGRLFDSGLPVGGVITGSDGTRLAFLSDRETVLTPAGTFEGCCLFEAQTADNEEMSICRTYYKDGVGIVRLVHSTGGAEEERILVNYKITGGDGLMPLAAGNAWEYGSGYSPDAVRSFSRYEVTYADGDDAVIANTYSTERLAYDEDSWIDAVEEIANEYWDGSKVCDVSRAVARAERLAKTPYEVAYTRAAGSVARRIMETNPGFNSGYTATGHWNFFSREIIKRKGGVAELSDYNSRWSFELKNTDGSVSCEPLLYNNIIGLLKSAVNCIWSDEWRPGAEQTVEFYRYGVRLIKTRIVCTASDPITTRAGTFEDCIKLSLDIDGYDDGLSYIGGHKEYYFARGVGIVRTVNEFCEGNCRAVYELTSYTGTGEGYMPLEGGLCRRYDAQDLCNGYVGAVDYEFVRDNEDQLVLITDRTGIRELPPIITDYSLIHDEVIEDKLWSVGKHDESRMKNDVNSFRLLDHFINRDHRTWKKAERSVAWGKYTISVIDSFRERGRLPDAWLGRYWWVHFTTACAIFGTKKNKDEGYRYLDRAFELYSEWSKIPAGAVLPVGQTAIYGGISLIKGKDLIELPDGTREPFEADAFGRTMGNAYYGMTAKRGWEWFDPVRDEELFAEYIDRARKLMEAE